MSCYRCCLCCRLVHAPQQTVPIAVVSALSLSLLSLRQALQEGGHDVRDLVCRCARNQPFHCGRMCWMPRCDFRQNIRDELLVRQPAHHQAIDVGHGFDDRRGCGHRDASCGEQEATVTGLPVRQPIPLPAGRNVLLQMHRVPPGVWRSINAIRSNFGAPRATAGLRLCGGGRVCHLSMWCSPLGRSPIAQPLRTQANANAYCRVVLALL